MPPVVFLRRVVATAELLNVAGNGISMQLPLQLLPHLVKVTLAVVCNNVRSC